MFNNISWQGYWVCLALLTAGYYLVIYLLYFRKDFSIEWRKRSPEQTKSPFFSHSSVQSGVDGHKETFQQSSLFGNPVEEFQLPEADSLELVVYSCMDEINAYLAEAKKARCAKEEIIYAFQSILKKYPGLSTSEYKESLTNVLVSQCEHDCSIRLSADDVVRVWVHS
ncbi:hypothetical protein HRH25_21900 [Flavisolibacter sp. BT320]|nr:hypothetical protein [Flavisolibacter longurius]